MGAEKLDINNIDQGRRENVILSSILFDEDCREYAIQNRIPTHYINNKSIRDILGIFNGLVSYNKKPSLDMLIQQTFPKEEDVLKRESLRKKLNKLKEGVKPAQVDVFKEHLYLLKKHRNLDKVTQVLQETIKKVQEEKNRPSYEKNNESINYLQENIDKIMEDLTPEEVKSMNLSEGLKSQLELINFRRENPETRDSSTSGYSELDNVLSGGFQKGYYSLVCARPAMGKTVFMLNLAIEAAKSGEKVLFISIEMDLVQCLQRVYSKISDVKLSKIINPTQLTTTDLNHLESTADDAAKLYGKNLFIEETVTLTPAELKSRISFYKKQFGVGLVFVDYVQIMRTKSGNIPREETDYAEISGELRIMTKELHTPVILGCQLSRDVEKRDDKRPMDSDLRNTGAFEQDAAAIIHLYRDAVYNKETEDKNILEVIIGKNRFGTGNVTLRFGYDYSCQKILQNAPVV